MTKVSPLHLQMLLEKILQIPALYAPSESSHNKGCARGGDIVRETRWYIVKNYTEFSQFWCWLLQNEKKLMQP